MTTAAAPTVFDLRNRFWPPSTRSRPLSLWSSWGTEIPVSSYAGCRPIGRESSSGPLLGSARRATGSK